MFSFILHTIFLCLSVILTFLWLNNPTLSHYNLQITGLLVLFYFVTRFLIKQSQKLTILLDALIFTVLTLLLVLSTGGASSPVFFLLYFLLFAISLLFEPLQSILITLLLTVFFVIGAWPHFDNQQLINLATLVLITPMAIILGKKYLETLESLGKIQILKNIIAKEETDSLLWISTQAKPSLVSTINSVSDLIMYFNSIGSKMVPTHLLEKLTKIHSDLILLYQSTDTLKQEISKEDDHKIR